MHAYQVYKVMVGRERGGHRYLFWSICNIIFPLKPELVYFLILSKAHTQEEFIKGSMTKISYSSAEIVPFTCDVKNKICHQMNLLGILELIVAGNIISLDFNISQFYEQVWRKTHSHATHSATSTGVLSASGAMPNRYFPPMTVTYRFQGLDGDDIEMVTK